MRGTVPPGELIHIPEVERFFRARRKAARLAREAQQQQGVIQNQVHEAEMGENLPPPPPPGRPRMGDYGLAHNRGQLTHIFHPANPVAFDIKNSVLQGLRENRYEGRDTQCPHEHLSRFYETFQYCVAPGNITEDQKKLRLFAFTLIGRAKDWLLALPSGTIQSWDELELKFLERFFPMSKYWEKKHEISNFRQGESESLYDAPHMTLVRSLKRKYSLKG